MKAVEPGNHAVDELWNLVYAQSQIDPKRLARLMEKVVLTNPVDDLDQRTRKLLQESLDALRSHESAAAFTSISEDARLAIQLLEVDPLSFVDRGFAFIGDALMDELKPDAIQEVLERIDGSLRDTETIYIGGSGSLILQGQLRRNTSDIDIVNEVPKSIRENRELLAQLYDQYRLHVAHFQSHYLPNGWQYRAIRFGAYEQLNVFVIDAVDIFVGKLFSKRIKDLDDLRVLKRILDRGVIVARLLESGRDLMADEFARPKAEANWKVLFGEKLPDVP